MFSHADSHSAGEDEVMIDATTKLIIAAASLCLALPAVAQFEINPDHFDTSATNVLQSRREQPKRSTRTPPYEQVQRNRVQAFTSVNSPENTLQTASSAAAVLAHRVSGAGRVTRAPLTEMRVSNRDSDRRPEP